MACARSWSRAAAPHCWRRLELDVSAALGGWELPYVLHRPGQHINRCIYQQAGIHMKSFGAWPCGAAPLWVLKKPYAAHIRAAHISMPPLMEMHWPVM